MAPRLHDITDPACASATTDRQILIRIVLFALALKLLVAVILPLGPDEAYATAVAREYSLSFFDHPPVSFWLPVIFADLTGIEHALIYRLPFLLAGVATTFVMYLIGREVGGTRAGTWTALLFSASPFFLLSGGVFVVPDGTLNLASAIAVLFLIRIARSPGTPPLKYWVFTGIALAFALGSKYQAAWLPVATLLFMIISPKGRGWFLQPGPWLAGVLGLFGLLPVVLWNMQNDWASFAFHTGRASGGLNPANLTLMLVGQVLFLLPAGLAAALIGLKLGLTSRQIPDRFLLALIALGPLVIFNYVYLTSSSSLAHWAMPGWQFALPLAGVWLATHTPALQRRFLRWTKITLVIIWPLLLLLVAHGNTGILTRAFYDKPPNWDNTLPIFDFKDLRGELENRDLWNGTDIFMSTGWLFSGILDTALKSEKPMQAFNTKGAHHFTYLTDATVTGTVIYMLPTRLKHTQKSESKILVDAQTLDPNAELLDPIILTRGGLPYVSVSLVRFTLN